MTIIELDKEIRATKNAYAQKAREAMFYFLEQHPDFKEFYELAKAIEEY